MAVGQTVCAGSSSRGSSRDAAPGYDKYGRWPTEPVHVAQYQNLAIGLVFLAGATGWYS